MDNNSSIWCRRRCTKGGKDKFFENLQKEIDEGKETVIIMGDLNGKVRNNNEGKEEHMGKEGEEKKNNNGDRIMDLYTEETESTENKQDTEGAIIFKEKEIVEAIRKIKVEKHQVLTRIIEKRIRDKLEETFEDSQGGFGRGRSTQDLRSMMRQISEKLLNKDREVHVCFMDLEKAFDHYSLGHRVAEGLKMSRGIASVFKTKFGRLQELANQRPSVGKTLRLRDSSTSAVHLLSGYKTTLVPEAGILQSLELAKSSSALPALKFSSAALTLMNREKNPNGPSTVTSLRHRNVPRAIPADFVIPNCFGTKQSYGGGSVTEGGIINSEPEIARESEKCLVKVCVAGKQKYNQKTSKRLRGSKKHRGGSRKNGRYAKRNSGESERSARGN
ncbi:uncharacterized protein CBL_10763 [Carabus blaptoides fortunei]